MTTSEDTPVGFELHAFDPDGDPVSIQIVDPPDHGTITLGTTSVRYEPASGFRGYDSLVYVVSDGQATSEDHTVTIVVEEVNIAPRAQPDSYSIDNDAALVVDAPGVLGNDADGDGDLLVSSLAMPPEHGRLELGADGGFTYRPDDGFAGRDEFTYLAIDPSGATSETTVTLRVAVAAGAGTDTRDGMTKLMMDTDGPETAPTDVDEPSVTRSLIVMGSAARAGAERVGFPFALLALLIAIVGTMGRVGLNPIFSRGEEEEGTVRMFDAEGGYGLLVRDSDGSDVFVHRTALGRRGRRVRRGDRVRFRVTEGAYRDVATRVRRLPARS